MHDLIPILTDRLSCLGICCDVHSRCVHYAAVNGSEPGESIPTCMTDDGYPLFVESPAAAVSE